MLMESSNHRWRMWAHPNRPYIYVRDLTDRNVRISQKPLRKDSLADCKLIFEKIERIGQGDWQEIETVETTSSWDKDYKEIIEYLSLRNKGSTNKNYISLLNNLKKNNIQQNSKAINKWLMEKRYGSKPFQTRLEFIRQLQKYHRNRYGEFPTWFTDEEYRALRMIHNDERKKLTKNRRKQDKVTERGIVSREIAEGYLDQHWNTYPWQCWCVAMMMCYGLRNHELFYIKKAKNKFIEVPGCLTKSTEDRIVWPAFPEWHERYKLFARFREHQDYLRSKRKPLIKSSTIAGKTYEIDDPQIYSDGVGDNNHALGEFITRNTLGVRYHTKEKRALPPLWVKSPKRGSKKPIAVNPYDLRHTFAVFMYTDPKFKKLKTAEECADAMGHSLQVHKQEYLLWLNQKEFNKSIIESHVHPLAAA